MEAVQALPATEIQGPFFECFVAAAGGSCPNLVAQMLQRMASCGRPAPDAAVHRALLGAITSGNADVCDMLMRSGGVPLERRDSQGWTAMMRAAWRGKRDALDVLLGWNAVLDARDDAQRTALHLAATAGRSSCVELLLAAEAAVDATDDTGWTPLLAAAHGGHTPVVALLLSVRASAAHRSRVGQTAKELADEEDATDCSELLAAAERLVPAS